MDILGPRVWFIDTLLAGRIAESQLKAYTSVRLCKANTARRRALLTNMLQEAPLLNASPLQLLEAPPRRRCCPPKYSCCCVLLTVLAALLVGAAAGGGLVATVLMQLAATPGSPDLPPASSCCAPTAGGLTGRFIGNVSATKTVLGS